jgi:hypothetical protein
VQSGNNANVVITAPSAPTVNIQAQVGPVAALLAVVNTNGPVNISELTVDGTGFTLASSGIVPAGIAYDSSSGAVAHVVSQNFPSNEQAGGILLLNDNGTPQTISVKNSLVRNGPTIGFFIQAPGLSVDLENNFLSVSFAGVYFLNAGGTISGNTMDLGNSPTSGGIVAANNSAPLTITGNTINNTPTGIVISSTLAATNVTKNVLSATQTGIDAQATLNATIQGNQIVSPSSGKGIDLACQANVPAISGNLFLGGAVGLANVSSGAALQKNAGTFVNVQNIEQLCP